MAKKIVKIESIEPIPWGKEVFNLHVANNHNYFAEGINVKNCHGFKAQSLVGIMTKATRAFVRVGVSGTLDGSLTNETVLKGLFGPVSYGPTTKNLMDSGFLSSIKIKNMILSYPKEDREKVRKMEYQEEIDFLLSHPKRNSFIKNLTLSLKGNTLLLFQRVEKHGKILYDVIRQEAGGRKVFFIHGGVGGEERDLIRPIVEKENDAIIVASLGTTSTGINIINLHNIIYVHPFKGVILTRQSIGRGLRIGSEKDTLTLFDLADDLACVSKKGIVKQNYALKHFVGRVGIYLSEGFSYKNYKLDI